MVAFVTYIWGSNWIKRCHKLNQFCGKLMPHGRGLTICAFRNLLRGGIHFRPGFGANGLLEYLQGANMTAKTHSGRGHHALD